MTATDLLVRWQKRDALYAKRRSVSGETLTPEEAVAVSMWRRKEAEELDGVHRLKALTSLSSWVPPRPLRY